MLPSSNTPCHVAISPSLLCLHTIGQFSGQNGDKVSVGPRYPLVQSEMEGGGRVWKLEADLQECLRIYLYVTLFLCLRYRLPALALV